MTSHGDECLAVLRLVRRLIDGLCLDKLSDHNLESVGSPIDTLVLFLKRLCHHCWTATGGPRNSNTLSGRCLLRTAEHVNVLQLSSELNLNVALEDFELFRDFVNSIPSCYSLMILPLWTCRFITDHAKQSLKGDHLGRSTFYPDMLNFFIRNHAFCEVRVLL